MFSRLGNISLIGNEREGEIKDDSKVSNLISLSHTEQRLK